MKMKRTMGKVSAKEDHREYVDVNYSLISLFQKYYTELIVHRSYS